MSVWTKLGSLKLSDWWRGFIVAVLTYPVTIIYESINAGSLVFDWKNIVLTGAAAGVAYLLKNLATGLQGNLLTNK